MKYKVGLIDDEKDIIMTFQRKNNGKKFYVNNREVEIEIVEVQLDPDIDEVINEINTLNVSAVLVDYLLRNKRADINYDGTDVINKLEEERLFFPTFMLTGHDEDAENSLIDVNKVYKKPDYSRDANILNKRIIRQIENYHNRIKQIQDEYDELARRRTELDMLEEERFIELDNLLEKSVANRSNIPTELKKKKNIELLQQLISATDDILKEVKKNER